MEVVLLKYWAGYKKGDVLNIADPTVIEKGISLKVFRENNREAVKETEENNGEAVKETEENNGEAVKETEENNGEE